MEGGSGVVPDVTFDPFEFTKGDILMQVKGSVRYVIYDLDDYSYVVVCLADGMMARASKRWLEEDFVKVGEWDFDNKEERRIKEEDHA